jgi:very-short-patch-repair endonuclease
MAPDRGYLVLRFWNHEVLNNIEGVLVRILEEMRRWERGTVKEPPS